MTVRVAALPKVAQFDSSPQTDLSEQESLGNCFVGHPEYAMAHSLFAHLKRRIF